MHQPCSHKPTTSQAASNDGSHRNREPECQERGNQTTDSTDEASSTHSVQGLFRLSLVLPPPTMPMEPHPRLILRSSPGRERLSPLQPHPAKPQRSTQEDRSCFQRVLQLWSLEQNATPPHFDTNGSLHHTILPTDCFNYPPPSRSALQLSIGADGDELRLQPEVDPSHSMPATKNIQYPCKVHRCQRHLRSIPQSLLPKQGL